MPVETRTIEPEGLPAWEAARRIGFHQPEPPPERAAGRAVQFASEIDFARTHGAFADGRVVATYRSFAKQLTVPGGFAAADAVTNVTVAPSHRRLGLLTQLMLADLSAARERGDAVAILVASEWPIYGRYGFGPAAEIVQIEIDTRAASFVRGG